MVFFGSIVSGHMSALAECNSTPREERKKQKDDSEK